MNPDEQSHLRLSGLVAMLGALLYALGDVLMLGVSVDASQYPNLLSQKALLRDLLSMVALPTRRLYWGALLGVFAAPLTLAGFWPLYRGLLPAGRRWALPPVLLFGWAQVVSPFLHGSFLYLGDSIQALNQLAPASQQVVAELLARQHALVSGTAGAMASCAALASLSIRCV